MSFMPRLSPEEVEELFQLYVKANVKTGVTPVEARNLTVQLRDRLRAIWDAGSKPFPFKFEDFRRDAIDQLVERFKKQTPPNAL
jgi:hypothetical protein